MIVFQLKEIIKRYSPNLTILLEIKNINSVMEKVKKRIEFDKAFVIDAVGEQEV